MREIRTAERITDRTEENEKKWYPYMEIKPSRPITGDEARAYFDKLFKDLWLQNRNTNEES